MVVDFVVEYIETYKDVGEQRWIVNHLHRRYSKWLFGRSLSMVSIMQRLFHAV